MGLEEHRKGSQSIGFAVITVSDTRRGDADTGGAYLVQAIEGAGHRVLMRAWTMDEGAEIESALREALAQPGIQMVLFTGGTGLARRDVTTETLQGAFDRPIPGFGELFRMLSFEEVGPASMLSRACAGACQGRFVCALPGSKKALELAMQRLLLPEAQHLVGQLGS